MPSPRLILLLLFVLCFGLAGSLAPRLEQAPGGRPRNDSMWTVLLGDSRRLFATHFFTKADVYFHRGYYPSVFDNRQLHADSHMAAGARAVESREDHETGAFLGAPRDWIDRFSRHFYPSEHTHLGDPEGHDASKCSHCKAGHAHTKPAAAGASAGLEREMLPWLRLAAELDPHRVETYTVSAYWLRTRMGKVAEAEAFLRDGLRANPDSYEILFELGRVFDEHRHDPDRARNLWDAALRKWEQREAGKTDPDRFPLQQILMCLARLEEKQGNRARAIACLERLKGLSPNPASIQKRIDELKAPSAPTTAARPAP